MAESSALPEVWNQIIQKDFDWLSLFLLSSKQDLSDPFFAHQGNAGALSWAPRVSDSPYWARNSQAMTYREVEREEMAEFCGPKQGCW